MTDTRKAATWDSVLEIWGKVSVGKCQGVCVCLKEGQEEGDAGSEVVDRFLGGYSPGGSRLLKSTLFKGWEKQCTVL